MATGNKKSNFRIEIDGIKESEQNLKTLKEEVDKLTASLKKSGMSNSEYVKTQNQLNTAIQKYNTYAKQHNKEVKENTTAVTQNTVAWEVYLGIFA